MTQIKQTKHSHTIYVTPEGFRDAYTELQKIVPISKHIYAASPRDGMISIQYDSCPELDSPEYMLWKMRWST